jgi:hypothetical protein
MQYLPTRPNLELKTRPKQLLASLSLYIALPVASSLPVGWWTPVNAFLGGDGRTHEREIKQIAGAVFTTLYFLHNLIRPNKLERLFLAGFSSLF